MANARKGSSDKPFTYKTASGKVIKISSKVTYDPGMAEISAFSKAREGGDEVTMAAAAFDMIRSGFPAEVQEQLGHLRASDLDQFMQGYFESAGVDIPKS